MESLSSSVVKVKVGEQQWEEEEAAKGSLPWDDGGGYTGIRSITIGYSPYYGWEETIQVEYDLFGKSVLGQERGADHIKVRKQKHEEIRKTKFVVDFPGEWVTGIYYSEKTDYETGSRRRRIYGLQLSTNRQRRTSLTHKPIHTSPDDSQKRRSVDGGTAGGAIVGFFGRSDGQILGSIGVYMAATTATGDLLDELHHQGLMPYRTSPLSLQY